MELFQSHQILNRELEKLIALADRDEQACNRGASTRLSDELRDQAIACGFGGLWVSAEKGGLDLNARESFEVAYKIAQASPSLSWILSQSGFHNLLIQVAFPNRFDELFEAHSLGANGIRGTGVKTTDPDCRGKVKWSGCYPLVSGFDFSSAVMVGDVISLTEYRIAKIPSSLCRVAGQWDSQSLSWSQSHTVSIEDAQIPAEHVGHVKIPKNRIFLVEDGCQILKAPFDLSGLAALAAVALGASTRLLNSAEESLNNVSGMRDLVDWSPVLELKLFIKSFERAMAAICDEGDHLSPDTSPELSIALLAEISSLLSELRGKCDAVYASAGAASLRQGSLTRRSYDDILGVLAHPYQRKKRRYSDLLSVTEEPRL